MERVLSNRKRYKYLINARNFHYENFNKWRTYFYVTIGGIFIGYYMIKSSGNYSGSDEFILIFTGYLVSLFWYWSCKGYYYMYINFIKLINNCVAKDLELKDHLLSVQFVFAGSDTENNYLNPFKGAYLSTSKIGIFFPFTISIIWGTLIGLWLMEFYNIFNSLSDELHIIISMLGSVICSLIFSYFIPRKFLQSKIDHFPELNITLEKYKKGEEVKEQVIA